MVKKEKTKDMSVQHTLQFDHHVKQEKQQFNEMIREQQAMIDEWTVPSESKIQKDSNTTSEMTISFDDETSDSISAQEVKHVQKGNATTDRVPAMYPIGQLQGTYILAQNENGLYMIDQHAAQERIKYEFFKDKLGKTVNESQELLLPLTFEFSRQEAIFIDQYKMELEEIGRASCRERV